jgi:hypothetical protein
VPNPRFTNEGTGDAGGGGDGGDGGGEALFAGGAIVPFPAVYNDGGVVKPVSYIAGVNGPLVALFAAAGFTVEPGFIANVNGAAVSSPFLTSTNQLGPLPFGTAEIITTLTKDGLTNVTRILVRLGP